MIGVPHCSTEDDVYNGYFIPKGSFFLLSDEDDLTYLYSNYGVSQRLVSHPEPPIRFFPKFLVGRAMCHDETKYPDPEAFKPERFLTDKGELNDDDQVLTYGF